MSDWMARNKAKWDAIKAKDAEAKRNGALLGRYVQHSIADGYATYEITTVRAKSVDLTWIDVDDGYILPAWGKKSRVTLSTVETLLNRHDSMTALLDNSDQWWQSQRLGSTVHYHNGFGQWVRGTVVERVGKNMIRPTALLGSWREFDLWTRTSTGTIRWGYHVQRIIGREPWQPHSSNMFEAGCKSGGDPTKLEPIDLNPPALSPEEQDYVAVAKLHKQVIDLLQGAYQGASTTLAERKNRLETSMFDVLRLLAAMNKQQ